MIGLLLMSMLAQASVYEEVITLQSDRLEPDEYDRLLEEAVGRAPANAEMVRLVVEDHDGRLIPADALLPSLDRTPKKAGEPLYRSIPEANVSRGTGFLENRAVYLSQCHGWIWFDSLGRFGTQRGNNFDTVEDFHNPEGMNQYLMSYLENAGAQLFPVKERDLNPLWAIADNDGVGYSETGSGFSTDSDGFGEQTTYAYGENPFKIGTSRIFPSDGGAVATWTPSVPTDGYYALYVAWQSASENSKNAHYRITHPGGSFDRYYDQTVHGSNWRYVATLWMTEGEGSVVVELIGDGTDSGRTLSADVVRIGGGMGVVERNGRTTERPRWEEGAILGTQFNGAPSSIYDPYSSGDGSDPTSRSRWSEWEHPAGEDAIYVSWHSNATATGSARGTVTYYAGNACSSGPAVSGSLELSELLQDEMILSFRQNWESDWKDRGVSTACFSEVAAYNNDEMPAALIELAFHDNETDAYYLKHPKFRHDASRAMYRGIVRYFAERDGLTPRYLPEPPVRLSARQGMNGVVLSWEPGPSGGILGDAATSYLVQVSSDGRSWSAGEEVSGTSANMGTVSGETEFFRVVARNEGGLSFPSDVVGASPSPDGQVPVLIVDAFDRLDQGMLGEDYPHSSLGWIARMNLRQMNTTDTVVAHATAVANAGWYFDSISDEALDDVDLSEYSLVIWGTGEESTIDETFSSDQQALLSSFVGSGGALWASGAEIFWDLDEKGDASDREFASNVLGATMASDNAGTETVNGEGVLEGVGAMDFSLDAGAPFPVEYPDTLSSERDVIARYTTGDIAGVFGEQVVVFGFPFETIGDPAVRDAVAAVLLPLLVPEYVPPEPTGVLPVSYPRVLLADLRGCACSSVASPSLGGLVYLWILGMFAARRRFGTQGAFDSKSSRLA